MAFKLRSHNTGSIPLHKNGTGSFKKSPFSNIKTPLMVTGPVDPTKEKVKKEKEKPGSEPGGYEEISRNITTREGFQNGVPGIFKDTTITKQKINEGYDIQVEPASRRTDLPDDEYIAQIKSSYPGITGQEAVERGFIKPEFAEQFPVSMDNIEEVVTTFDPNEEIKKQYQGFVSGSSTASDFGAVGYNQRYDSSNDQAKELIRRMRANEEANVQPVEKIRGNFNQGGSAGLVDKDRRNRQAEQGEVFGIINREDYDLGQNFGIGYINKNYKNAINAARQSFQAHRDPKRLQAEKEIALALANEQRKQASSGTFATPEMEQRYNQSYDTLYSRMLNAPMAGGGRTGRPVTSATTNVDTGYFN